jgi:hypothetical protein
MNATVSVPVASARVSWDPDPGQAVVAKVGALSFGFGREVDLCHVRQPGAIGPGRWGPTVDSRAGYRG